MCKNKTESKTLLVKDAMHPNVESLCAYDSMRKAGPMFASGVTAIPIVDYAGELVGSLLESNSIQFLNAYFENLSAEDRGNEFLFEQESELDIHFVPIDQISRYMLGRDDKQRPVITVEQTLEKAESLLCEQGNSSALVYDGDEAVGSVSLNGIAFARQRSKEKCCQKCKAEKKTAETYTL